MKKNNKKNPRRAAYEARQEKEGQSIVKWIFATLVVLGLCFVAYYAYIMS
ncbi:MAG: hypothetical protein IJ355_01165 [Prevotella sp.]|nr:hypothetical protein [Prevotella sp.]